MPNIQEWIEAQLKKGYSASRIKAFLIKRGYPSKAVAEVDRLGLSNLHSKPISKKLPAAILVLLILIAGFVMLLNVYQKPSQFTQEPQQSAEIIIGNFLEKNLKNEFIRLDLVAEQRMKPEGKIGSDRLSGYNWEEDNAKFYASTEYNANDSKILNKIVEIFIDSNEFSEPIANSTVKQYFKGYGILKCGISPKTKSQYCESYISKEDAKVFVGAWFSDRTGKIVAFACEIPAGSEIYGWKSCSKPFKDTGVQ